MKTALFSLVLLLASVSAFAVPRGMYLASPTKINVSGSYLKLTFHLPCSNDFPDEWAGNLVAVSDDEGDMSVAVGVILSKGSCVAGPMKKFVFSYPLTKAGVAQADLTTGLTFEPMDLAK